MISKFKDFIKESIIDIPRRTYAPGVFDDADTDNPKLKQKVLDIIKKDLKTFEKFGPVVSVKLIGSILGKRYRNDADLDIDILIDLPPEDRETIGLKARKSVSLINGRNIPGTKHPINYYVQSDPAVNDAHLETADGIFDVFKQKMEKRPKDHKFDPKVYQAEFEKKVSEIDVVKGELKRDIIDYEELKELSPKDIEGLQKKISEKLKEIEDAIEKFSKMGDELMQARRDLFNRPMTPEEIKKEQENYIGQSGGPGSLMFTYGDGDRDAITYQAVQPKERDIFIFPAWLKHYVVPFYSDVTRISVAGNVASSIKLNQLRDLDKAKLITNTEMEEKLKNEGK